MAGLGNCDRFWAFWPAGKAAVLMGLQGEGVRLNEGRQRVMVERCKGLQAQAAVSTVGLAWRIYPHQHRTGPGL